MNTYFDLILAALSTWLKSALGQGTVRPHLAIAPMNSSVSIQSPGPGMLQASRAIGGVSATGAPVSRLP